MVRKRKLLLQIFLPFFLIIVVSLSVLAWYASDSMSRFHKSQTKKELKERALIVTGLLRADVEAGRYDEVNRKCREIGKKTSTRLTVVLPSGEVAADSDYNPLHMDNHSTRPELKKAFAGQVGFSSRFSKSLQKEMMYLAIPLTAAKSESEEVDGSRGHPFAAVRVSIPSVAVTRKIGEIQRDILTGGGVVALLAVLASLWVSYRVNKITKQQYERDAVLFSMVEPVVAVDADKRLIRCNRAARSLFGVGKEKNVLNRPVREVIRNPELESFVLRTLSSPEPVSDEIAFLHDGRDRYLQAQGARLRNESGESMGALIVLHDVTRLKRLEAIRTEFVANVSHELKTPIASIRGSAETLKDGAMEDPADAKQFLNIIIRHTERLASIVDDLLNLSRIEQDESEGLKDRTMAPVSPVLHSALLAVREQAEEKNISFNVNCPSSLKAFISPRLMEHAVFNLLDNAVKYSVANGKVSLSTTDNENELILTVKDGGCGIAEEHHKRVFERFYRVDKARSRKLGGTGLGLAIVKHIATAHNGSVSVNSEPGRGSSFTIRLPRSITARKDFA